MAEKVQDIDHGFAAFLAEIRSATALEVVTGIQEGAVDDEGTTVAEYAAANEYGAKIEKPARTQTIYKRLKKGGNFTSGGRFVKITKSNFAQDVDVGAHEIIIPERPFMRPSFDENVDIIQSDAARAYKAVSGGAQMYTELSKLGIKQVIRVKAKITSNVGPENKASTIARKGSDKTLRDKGTMINSVHFLVRAAKSGK